MILFNSDWELYPDCIIDTETKNTSFLRLSALYREMGVENHAICLQLHDRDLQGVDPYDPTLTPVMKVKIALECKRNFFTFSVRSPETQRGLPNSQFGSR